MTTVIPGCHIAKCDEVGVAPHIGRMSGVDHNVNITYLTPLLREPWNFN